MSDSELKLGNSHMVGNKLDMLGEYETIVISSDDEGI